MGTREIWEMSAAEVAGLIRAGKASSVEVVESCLGRIRETEPRVEAWIYLDPEYARTQAKASDEWRLSGRPIGGLHGVPVGLKDIIDTADMPTESGSGLHAGRTPSRDAVGEEGGRAGGGGVEGEVGASEVGPAGRRRERRHPHPRSKP